MDVRNNNDKVAFMKRLKNYYENEILVFEKSLDTHNDHDFIMKLQEWLSIWVAYNARFNQVINIDGKFDDKTEDAVMAFQKFAKIDATGAINKETWDKITTPMRKAFEIKTYPFGHDDIAARVSHYAFQYEKWRPYEIDPNFGPWVRSFMDGHDGEKWAWCAGFVQTVLDSVFSDLEIPYTKYFKKTYRVEEMRVDARDKGVLHDNKSILNGTYKPKQGDIFVIIYDGDTIAHHTGIITALKDASFLTIEGNTNFIGSNNGVGVFRLERNFKKINIEVIESPVSLSDL